MQTAVWSVRPLQATPILRRDVLAIEDKLIQLQSRYCEIATAALEAEARTADATFAMVSRESCAKPFYEFGGVILRVVPPEKSSLAGFVREASLYDRAAILMSFTVQLVAVVSERGAKILCFRDICPLGSVTAERIHEVVTDCGLLEDEQLSAKNIRQYIVL